MRGCSSNARDGWGIAARFVTGYLHNAGDGGNVPAPSIGFSHAWAMSTCLGMAGSNSIPPTCWWETAS